ncbi:MAG: MBL fold metallo-hydrolase [Fimbriimonadaceae bacterium]
MQPRITFHGAAETVTGSRHLIEHNGKRILVDCGLFQGSSELSSRNYKPFPVEPSSIDAVVLTHGHTDHIGYLPCLVKHGYSGPIYATGATIGICKISLPDSGRLQEEDARHRAKRGDDRPALYTEQDAYATMKSMKRLSYDDIHPLPGGMKVRYLPAGHILGSAFAEIYFDNGERIMMSGDLGRYNTPIIKDPTAYEFAEYLTIESTYGDRLHKIEDTTDRLAQILNDSYKNASVVLVPSFAIGRTQELLYFIHKLQDEGRCPRVPIYIDSPMAISTTDLYRSAYEEHDEDMLREHNIGHAPLEPENVTFVRDRELSKELNSRTGPMMIIAGSGMANGGRIVHHMMHRLGDPSTVVLFTGYQAQGTLGRRLIEGAPMVRIFGQEVSVQAQVEKLNALSAHADQGEMLRWLGGFKSQPKKTFIVHGEPPAQAALQAKIKADLGWDTLIPKWGESFELI